MGSIKSFIQLRWRTTIIYLLVFLAIWLPRAIALDVFVTVDEPQWLYRSSNFYYTLAQREFGQTSLTPGSGKNLTPGVLTMWVETFAYLIEFPEYRGFGQGLFTDPSQIEKFLVSKDVNPLEILVTARQIFAVWNATILLFAFGITHRLFGLWPSLLGFLLIAFEPYHIALTKIAHLDGPMSGLMLLSVLAFVAYVYDGRRVLYLIVSAVACGLAILTKQPGILLIPFMGLISLLLIFKRWNSQTEKEKPLFWSWVRPIIFRLVLWGGIAIFTIILLWPEMWVDPIGIFSDLLRVSANQTRDTQMVLPEGVAELPSLRFNVENMIRYIPSYLWHTTPIIIFGLLAALIAYIRKAGLFASKKIREVVFTLVLFVLTFVVPITIASTTSHRYIIPIYLPLNLIAALGWVEAAAWLKRNLSKPLRKYAPPALLVGIVSAQLFLAAGSHPYYFTYFNPLLGGSKRAGEVFESGIGLGEGLDQAAAYLNDKPDSEKLRVKSWYYSGPFSYFFSGISVGIPETNEWPQDRIAEIGKMDYLVIYINQWKRRIPERLIDALDLIQPEHIIWINEIEYVRIYAVNDFPDSFYEYLVSYEE